MATNVPEPTNTPNGPAYEGRLLDRPDDEVVDQGARFDIETLVSRRLFIGAGLAGIGSLALAACAPSTTQASQTSSTSAATSTATSASSSATSATTTTAAAATDLSEIPDETAGPYPGDGSNGPDVLEESGIVRQNLRTSIGSTEEIDGVPLTFTLNIIDMANGIVPFTGAAVYAWHANALGEYSMYSTGTENETWLRGVQVVDDSGNVTFESIVPGCYDGRWPHIHFEVYPSVDDISDAENAIAVSQLALPQEPLDAVYQEAAYTGSAENMAKVSLATDNVFGDDGGVYQIATVTGDVTNGYTATLTVPVDTTTEVTAGSMGGAGGPGGSGQPPAMPS